MNPHLNHNSKKPKPKSTPNPKPNPNLNPNEIYPEAALSARPYLVEISLSSPYADVVQIAANAKAHTYSLF